MSVDLGEGDNTPYISNPIPLKNTSIEVDSGVVMVWSGISLGDHVDLLVFHGQISRSKTRSNFQENSIIGSFLDRYE